MAPVSNACWWRQIVSVTRTVPGETESSSAEVQLDKGYLGRPCANGAADPRRTCVRRGLFFQKPIGHWSMPKKIPSMETLTPLPTKIAEEPVISTRGIPESFIQLPFDVVEPDQQSGATIQTLPPLGLDARDVLPRARGRRRAQASKTAFQRRIHDGMVS